MVNLTIDGKNIEVPDGTTVLRAAQANDIFVPTLCDHKHLSPYGGCRMCLVEVEGARTLQPSCTLPVSPNMKVTTSSERINEARKFVLTMIFSERNHFCPYCQVSGGDCELQNAAYAQDMTHWPLQPNWQKYEMDASHPYIILENNRCILCRRCVRACAELVGNFTLGFEERGARSLLVADFGVPLGESSCISCGMCVQVCPTGALIDRESAYRGRETQVEHHQTVCIGCSIGCGIDVLTRDNTLVRIEGDWDAPVNAGVICKTGRFSPTDESRERIITPLVRKEGKLKAATWEEALTTIASVLKPLSGKKDSGIAAIASTRLPAEALFVFKELFEHKLESDMVTGTEEGKFTFFASQFADQMDTSFEGSLDALTGADCIITAGVDLTKDHEVAGFFIKRILPNGVSLITIGTEPTPFDKLAEAVIAVGKGNISDALQSLAQSEGKEEGIKAANQIINNSKKVVIIYGDGIGTVDTMKSLLDLAKKFSATLISVKGQANSVAAAQYKLDTPLVLGDHKAVFLALGDEDPSEHLAQSLEKSQFLVVQASYVSKLSAKADVVLPVEMWAEQEGHYINFDGRIQKASKSLNAPPEVKASHDVLQELAEKLGYEINDSKWKDHLNLRVPVVAIK